MTPNEAMNYVASCNRGILTTIKRDGRPQMAPVDYTLDEDGLIKMQITNDSAKAKNLRRDDRVSLSVLGDNWYQYVVVEGTAKFIDDDRIAALRHVYERIAGKPHPDWDEFDQAMVDEQQVVLTISVDRLYPVED